jgi:hypothetical protein
MTGPDYVANGIVAIDSKEAQRIALSMVKGTVIGFVKKGNCIVEEQPGEIAVIETVNIADLLVLPESTPADFYSNPAFAEQIEKAIELSSGLTYTTDQEAEMNAAVKSISRYATGIDKIAAAIYKSETDTANANRTQTKGYVKALNANADAIKSQFTEEWARRLREVQDVLFDVLTARRTELNIDKEFFKAGCDALTPIVKLTGTLTETGKMTKKARDFIDGIVNAEMQQQITITNQRLIVANRSLVEGINPPLAPEYLGLSLYSDEAAFLAKLGSLVAIEAKRKSDAQAHAEAKEVARQAAVKSKADAELKSVEKQPVKVTINPAITQQEIDALRYKAKLAEDDRKNPPVPQKTGGLRTVMVTLTFEIPNVKPTSSNEAVERYLISLLPESLRDRIKGAVAENV